MVQRLLHSTPDSELFFKSLPAVLTWCSNIGGYLTLFQDQCKEWPQPEQGPTAHTRVQQWKEMTTLNKHVLYWWWIVTLGVNLGLTTGSTFRGTEYLVLLCPVRFWKDHVCLIELPLFPYWINSHFFLGKTTFPQTMAFKYSWGFELKCNVNILAHFEASVWVPTCFWMFSAVPWNNSLTLIPVAQ